MMKVGRIINSVFASLVLIPCLANSAPRLVSPPEESLTPEETDAVLQAITSTPPIPADEAPTVGTFYSAQHGEDWPPMPGNMGLPVWNLGDGIYLIDDLNTVDSSELSKMGAMTMSVPDLPPDDGGTNYDGGDGTGGYTNQFFGYSFDTNGLWLELTNVANGYASGNLHNATNSVYAILSNTNLLTANWNIEQAIWPDTNRQATPFTVGTLDRQDLFLRAMDWTGVTHDGNTIPDGWFWTYFGTTNLLDTDLDSQGNTLLSDYQNGKDPNIISFSVSTANNYINTYAMAQLNITGGSPKFIAVSLDDTNYAVDGSWQAFSGTNLTINLGSIEGWHDVWIGLRGLPENATQTWQKRRLKLDLTPPLLVITNPISNSVGVGMIQLQGYSPEPLASITYEISNTNGTLTKQLALITKTIYNTNTAELTTNFFQCYDVSLAEGLNTITFRAEDWAGNISTTVANITFCAPTNLPSVQLLWPRGGTRMSGENFTIKGRVSDPTINVTVATTGSDGNTNFFSGLTGRDGIFWIQGVPLGAGTNDFTLTATGASGQCALSFSVVKSDAVLTIDPVQAGQRTVTGAINLPGYTVWANGVKATQTNGIWTAQIASIGIGGGLVGVTAIPDTDNGGNGSGSGSGTDSETSNPASPESIDAEAVVDSPQGVFISDYHYNDTYQWFWGNRKPDSYNNINWEDGLGGSQSKGEFEALYVTDTYLWPSASWPEPLPEGTVVETGDYVPDFPHRGSPYCWTNTAGPLTLSMEHCDGYSEGAIDDSSYDWAYWFKTDDSQVKLATGGPLGSTQKNLWRISATASDLDTGLPIPCKEISIGSFGKLDENGELWLILPDNDPDLVTPTTTGHANYSYNPPVANKYRLRLYFNGRDITESNALAIVGQQITLSCALVATDGSTPPPITNFQWSVPEIAISNYVADAHSAHLYVSFPLTNSFAQFYWVDGGEKEVSCTVIAKGQEIKAAARLDVFRPGNTISYHMNSVSVDTNYSAYPNEMCLHFGIPDAKQSDPPANPKAGILWKTTPLQLPSGFSGHFEWIQIIDAIETFTMAQGSLDTNVWIGFDPDKYPVTGNWGEDSPGTELLPSYVELHRTDKFNLWLMFKLDGYASIPVPLKKLEWGWDGHAVSSTNSNSWSGSGSPNVNGPIDTYLHPTWNRNRTDK